MTETKGVIPLITRRINKNINKLTLENYIPSFRAVALFPSQLHALGETSVAAAAAYKEVPKWLNKWKHFSVRRIFYFSLQMLSQTFLRPTFSCK